MFIFRNCKTKRASRFSRARERRLRRRRWWRYRRPYWSGRQLSASSECLGSGSWCGPHPPPPGLRGSGGGCWRREGESQPRDLMGGTAAGLGWGNRLGSVRVGYRTSRPWADTHIHTHMYTHNGIYRDSVVTLMLRHVGASLHRSDTGMVILQ